MTIELMTEEELARIKIRQWFQEEKAELIKPTRKERAWKVINAPIFLWLMSSVLLSGLIFCSNFVSSYFEEQRAIESHLEKLRVELAYRLEPAVLETLYTKAGDQIVVSHDAIEIHCISPKQNAQTVAAFATLLETATPLNEVQRRRQYQKSIILSRFVFPEFENRSHFSLLWELQTISTDSDERQKARAAHDAINVMRADALNRMNSDWDTSIKPIEDLLSEWQNGAIDTASLVHWSLRPMSEQLAMLDLPHLRSDPIARLISSIHLVSMAQYGQHQVLA